MARIIAIQQRQDGRRQAGPPQRDDRFIPVVEWVLSGGAFDQPYLVPLRFTPNRDEAEDIRKSLYNAARYYCSCGSRNCCRKFGNVPNQNETNPAGGCPNGGRRVSCQAKLVMHKGHVRVEFRFFDKREAMREIIAKYGPDPSAWPYQAKAKKLKG